ncbi:hypothetical protein Y032_0041g388 [Ancylostoma ceylanicum]|uniref:Endonuclease/exonuclease/phosphatase domain-containing protein n=1 Tax=Ancylostoma ceylanicum TaxID=53326 RepID=A0A016UGZ2_9BILA|nr:hypothetical protein Y032_0041g388 [Ancylostoma ceylanicum]
MCSTHALSQYVKTGTSGDHILNLVLSSVCNLIKDVEVLPPIGFSDHSSVHFKVNCRPIGKDDYVVRRDFRPADYGNVKSYLEDVDWFGSLNSVQTVDEKYELFVAISHSTVRTVTRSAFT